MEFLGQLLGALTVAGGVSLFVFQAFRSEGGFEFIKRVAIFGFILGALAGLSALTESLGLFSPLVNLFAFLKGAMYLFDFAVDVPLLITLVSTALAMLSAYWSLLLFIFVYRFFRGNQ